MALGVLVVIDFYVFQGARVLIRKWPTGWRRTVYGIYWGATAYVLLSFILYRTLGPQGIPPQVQRWSTVFFFVLYVSKIPALLFLVADDLRVQVREHFGVLARVVDLVEDVGFSNLPLPRSSA